jgi:hypothetical protein
MVETPGSTAPDMTLSTDEQAAIASYVDHTATLLGMVLSNEHRPGVIATFTAFGMAAKLLMDFPLPAEIEPASVYSLGDESDDR